MHYEVAYIIEAMKNGDYSEEEREALVTASMPIERIKTTYHEHLSDEVKFFETRATYLEVRRKQDKRVIQFLIFAISILASVLIVTVSHLVLS